jgi:uncharacterized protein (TIGR02284 family)
MEKEDLFDRINELMNLDYDAIKGYDKAIDDIDNRTIQEQLRIFRADHERHIRDYRSLMQQLGGKAEEPNRHLKGAFLEAMAAIRSKLGTRNALKACEGAESIVNSRYRDAVAADLPLDVMPIVHRNYADEQRHLAYIQLALQKKVAA